MKDTKKIKKILSSQQFIAGISLVVLYIYFSISSPAFRSTSTITSIFDAAYYIGFLAIGVTFVIATGGIDLSLGTGMITSAIIGGLLYQNYGMPVWVSMIVTLLVGILLGALNGFLVAKLKIAPFIATLGTQMLMLGLGSIVSKVQTVNFPLRSSPDGYYKSLFRTNNNFPTGIFIFLGLALIFYIILNKTKTGRYILSIGSNEDATRLSGIDVVKWKWRAYIISGFFIGLAGIAYASTYTSITPGLGTGIETNAIAAAIIGGTSMTGGIASLLGTVIGVFIMGVLQTGLPFIGLQPHYQIFITGIVIIVAVYIDVFKRRNDTH
ncbi:ABC transporter permease [Erysipelothrix inopinata]|uniref:ABC transporter permease n=1 Tax=Erysipelothrix inopinata TaxID=225084 RepID=UPI0039EE096A